MGQTGTVSSLSLHLSLSLSLSLGVYPQVLNTTNSWLHVGTNVVSYHVDNCAHFFESASADECRMIQHRRYDV